jgi:hypothetical protein
LVNDKGTHFIIDAIEILTNHFLLRHTTLTTYCLQGNEQAKSTNKIIGSLLTRLVNENLTNWDEHLHMILYVYHTTFKLTMGHIPFQLVYGLYPLIPMEYLLPMSNSHHGRNFFPTHILTIHMVELEHLDETHQEATDRIGTRQWNIMLWVQRNHKIKTFSMGDTILWFPKGRKKQTKFFLKWWFGSYKI